MTPAVRAGVGSTNVGSGRPSKMRPCSVTAGRRKSLQQRFKLLKRSSTFHRSHHSLVRSSQHRNSLQAGAKTRHAKVELSTRHQRTESVDVPVNLEEPPTPEPIATVNECTEQEQEPVQEPSTSRIKRTTTIRRQPTFRISASAAAQYRRKHAARRRYVPRRRPRKIVVVGDMCSGKSGLISAYCRDQFNDMYTPTILRSCQTDAKVFGEKIDLVVVEVAGRDDYARLRRCAYHKMDAVILCYSADSVTSLEKVTTQWLPEVKEYAPKVPYILVGTKKDAKEDHIYHELLLQGQLPEDKVQSLRTESFVSKDVVTTSHGFEVAQSIGAHSFLECSALYRDGTREVFETVTKIALKKSRRKRKVQRSDDICTIL